MAKHLALETDRGRRISILARANAYSVKAFADDIIPRLGPIEVLHSRTGLVTVSMSDSAKDEAVHIGEVLVTEVHVRVSEAEGYAACPSGDLEHAIAAALIDVASASGPESEKIAVFVAMQQELLAAQGQRLSRSVESTRVEMDTF